MVCCETNKKGKNISTVVKATKCTKGTVCPDTNPTNVGDGCTAQGTCVTTTTTTTTTLGTPTTETPTTTTSSTTLGKVLEFSLTAAGGTCGETRDASNAVLANLTCGGLNIGGGGSVIPEGPTPDGSISRFALECTGSSCTILPTAFSLNPPINTPGPDCTDVGCNFGTPLPIPNPLAGGSADGLRAEHVGPAGERNARSLHGRLVDERTSPVGQLPHRQPGTAVPALLRDGNAGRPGNRHLRSRPAYGDVLHHHQLGRHHP